MLALTFPGQGSQAIGMGRALADAYPAARAVFEEVDSTLGQDLSGLMWSGDPAELNLTANAQPALMAVSMAAFRALGAETGLDLAGHVRFVAGHSLGEYSALAAAGSITVADAARLLRIRGDAMQRAVPVGEGAMAALLGLEREPVEAIAREAAQDQVCDLANDNGPGQVVVSGDKEAVERAVALAQARGCRRAVMLPVSAPFHCALMAPAAAAMREALATVELRRPAVPVFANVEAAPIEDPDAVREALIRQVTATVRWRESVAAMAAAGIERFVEIGSGKVLTGLAKRIAPAARAASFGQPSDLDAILAMLEG